jgi:2-phospho-L-lactate guanylyltransferase (CobY/MobA/RfbA family)
MSSGTPKTLNEAIQNAIEESKSAIMMGIQKDVSVIIEKHVKDFLAQKFAPKVFEAKGYEAIRLESLWYEITGKKI